LSNVIRQTTEHPIQILTGITSATINAGRFVGYGGNDECSVRGMRAWGVSVVDASDVGSIGVITRGTALVTAGEPLEDAASVTTDGYGRAVVALPGEYVNGIVLNGQPITGNLVEIQLIADILKSPE
jgi:hypothetical protein